MTADEPTTRERVETTLRALEKRDAVAAASAYAEDGVFVDPQYSESEYRGRESIWRALNWGLTNIAEQPEFTIRHILETGDICAVEVETNHVDVAESGVEFPQVFVVEAGEQGITRWRTYHPFPPE